MTDTIFTIIDNEVTLYCVKDVCNFLEITNTTRTLERVDKRNVFTILIKRSKSGKQLTKFVNLEGVKNIVLRSKSSKVKSIIETLDLSIDVIFPKEEAHYINIIETSFDFYKTIKQHSIGKYFIDLYFPDFNLVVEIDENNHRNRCKELEKVREEFIIKELNCKMIRFNPTIHLFNIGTVISQIFKHIRQY
jgi:very-short-patch-repair endonuclease